MESSIDEPPSQLLTILAEDTVFFATSGLLMLGLIVMSALISGSEVAFFSLSPNDVANCKGSTKSSDKKLVALIKTPKLLLATILIVNNFVNVAFVTVSTFVVWEITGTKMTGGWLIATLTAIVTFVIVFFGEVLPKVYATANNLKFARMTAPMLTVYQTALKPISKGLMFLSNVIEKRYKTKGYDVSVEELHQALELTTTNDGTTEDQKDILKGIVNFGTLTVKQVMKSRMDVIAFDIDIDFHELMDKINKSGFSRIPVYSETIDKIEGILYIKDLLPFIDEDENFKWQELLRPGFFVPEAKKIDGLLRDFQEKRVHMAIVVDEYGGTSGLITLEDIIEEIVGEINDEFDEEASTYKKINTNTFLFEGKTTLNDFCKVVEENPATFEEMKGDSESLGGLLLEINSALPSAGEKIYFDKFIFTVVAVDNKRIKKVQVIIEDKPEQIEN